MENESSKGNPFAKKQPEGEIELDSLGRPKGKFDRRFGKDRNPFKKIQYKQYGKKGATNIHLQLRERNEMANLPIDVIVFVKYLYSQRRTWRAIYKLTVQKFPSIKGVTEERLYQIYEGNKDEFKKAREDYEKRVKQEFNEDRENLLMTTLSAELQLAEKLQEQVNKLSVALDEADPSDPEQSKHYGNLVNALDKVQRQLEKLTNTDRFRRLEESRQLLLQKKEILGLEDAKKEEEITSVNVIGVE